MKTGLCFILLFSLFCTHLAFSSYSMQVQIYNNQSECERVLTPLLAGSTIIDLFGGEMGDLVGETEKKKEEKKQETPPSRPPEPALDIVPVEQSKKTPKDRVPARKKIDPKKLPN